MTRYVCTIQTTYLYCLGNDALAMTSVHEVPINNYNNKTKTEEKIIVINTSQNK